MTRQQAIDAVTRLSDTTATGPVPTVAPGASDSALAAAAGGVGGLGPLSADQAACVTDRLIARWGLKTLSAKLRAPRPDDDLGEALIDDQFRCGVGGSPRQQILDLLTGSGVNPTTASCMADQLAADLTDADIGVILSGDDNPSFNQKFTTALQSCGAAS